MGAVSTAWGTNRDDVIKQAERLVEAISQTVQTGALADEGTLRNAYSAIASSFDPVNGGFGGAPKFPQQPVLEFLLRIRDMEWAGQASQIIEITMDRMAAGGIHDQIGGGFARYSVDDHWLVPHFEKMLYDNAQLGRLYLWAGVELDRTDFLDVSRSTLDYMLRDLRHRDGGFFSSEDADSEGVEGKFYVWSADQIRELLGSDAERVLGFYGVTDGGNFEGTNILNVVGEEPPPDLDQAKETLLDARSQRIRPGLDDKVIASWNGLAIRAFAEAGAVLQEPGYLDAARNAARFVVDNLMVDGRLMRSWREGQTSVRGFLDDHAAMAVGLFALYAATGELEWYQAADKLVEGFDRFTNSSGGFYSTADDSANLIKRPNDSTDNPLPSGNALAAEALLLSSLYKGDAARRVAAEGALQSVGVLMGRYPSMVGHHLAVSHSLSSTKELAIVGADWENLAAVYWARFRPHVVLAGSQGDADSTVPLLADRHQQDQTLAYVCEGFVCDLPTSDPQVLTDLLR